MSSLQKDLLTYRGTIACSCTCFSTDRFAVNVPRDKRADGNLLVRHGCHAGTQSGRFCLQPSILTCQAHGCQCNDAVTCNAHIADVGYADHHVKFAPHMYTSSFPISNCLTASSFFFTFLFFLPCKKCWGPVAARQGEGQRVKCLEDMGSTLHTEDT